MHTSSLGLWIGDYQRDTGGPVDARQTTVVDQAGSKLLFECTMRPN